MKWQPEFRTTTNYLCDPGLGGKLVFVGTAVNIWEQSPTNRISAASLASVLAAKKKADSGFSADRFLGRSGATLPSEPSENDIRESDIKAVQKMLRAEFDAAAVNWKQWKPVKYPNSDRRDECIDSARAS
jgi:hypothetical protein